MSSNTESNFRNAFKNFGARGGVSATDNAATSSGGTFGRASEWFGGVRSQVQGYVPVSLGGTPAPEEDWLGLSWFQVNHWFLCGSPLSTALLAYTPRPS